MSFVTRSGELSPRAWSAIGGGLMHVLFSTRESILRDLHRRHQKASAERHRIIRQSMIKAHAARYANAHPLFHEVMNSPDLQDAMANELQRDPQASFTDLYSRAKTPRLP